MQMLSIEDTYIHSEYMFTSVCSLGSEPIANLSVYQTFLLCRQSLPFVCSAGFNDYVLKLNCYEWFLLLIARTILLIVIILLIVFLLLIVRLYRGVTTIDIEGDKSPPIIRNGQMSPPIFEILALICCPPLRSALVRMTKKALKVTFSVCSASAG